MKTLLVMMIGLISGAAAFAGSPGGSDYCGLGWEITNKKSFLATTTRSTTNAFVPPTFGMTTGTIGCDKHSLAMRDVPAAQFASSHYDALLFSMAQGQGEELQALAKTMGCSDAAIPAFGEMTRASFSDLTKGENSLELIRKLREEMQKNSALSQACSA